MAISELQKQLSTLLIKLRIRHGLSKFKMATLAEVSDHTWDRYESGESSPTLPEFINIYNELGEDALRDILSLMYPDKYNCIVSESNINDLRESLIHYFSHVASERVIREWAFLTFGEHGSSSLAQLEMFTMIDHLPMKYRYMVAESISKYYEMASAHNELVATDEAIPDVELFRIGLNLGKEATMEKKESYSLTKKDED